jgi:hypothetical protein
VMSLFNKLPCELSTSHLQAFGQVLYCHLLVCRPLVPFLVRSDRTNLYLLFSQGGFKKHMKQALDRVGKYALDPLVMWEWCGNYANTDHGDRSSLIFNTEDKKTPGILLDKTRSLLLPGTV